MSFTYRTYVGPYVVCISDLVTDTCAGWACATPGCRSQSKQVGTGGGTYCPNCGQAFTAVEVPITRPRVDSWKMRGLLHDLVGISGDPAWRASQQGRHTLVAAEPRADGGRDWRLEPEADFFITAISPADVALEIALFERQFANALATLRTVYGAANVEVRWGIIQDYY